MTTEDSIDVSRTPHHEDGKAMSVEEMMQQFAHEEAASAPSIFEKHPAEIRYRLESILTSEVQKEVEAILDAQAQAIQRGYLADAILSVPPTGATGHTVHLMPQTHVATETGNVSEAAVQSQKNLFFFWKLLQEQGVDLPLHIETLGISTDEAMPQQPQTQLVDEDTGETINAISPEGQSLLLEFPEALEQILRSPRHAMEIIDGVERLPTISKKTKSMWEKYRNKHSQEDFRLLHGLMGVQGSHITIQPKCAERIYEMMLELDAVVEAMDADFVRVLTEKGNAHVQQLTCGRGHMEEVTNGLLAQGSTVLQSIEPESTNRDKWKRPSHLPVFIGLEKALRQHRSQQAEGEERTTDDRIAQANERQNTDKPPAAKSNHKRSKQKHQSRRRKGEKRG